MFSGSGSGVFDASGAGAFVSREPALPDELRVVVAGAASATATVHVRVLTRGAGNDVHDYHNPALLATKVAVTVSDAQGPVAATAVEVASVGVFSGTYAAYKVTLARAVVPSEIVAVSVLAPYVHGTLATTPGALVSSPPVVEVEGAQGTPPGVAGAQATLTLGGDYGAVTSSPAARAAFEGTVAASIGAGLGIEPSSVEVVSVAAGSVVVEVFIANGDAAGAAEQVAQLQTGPLSTQVGPYAVLAVQASVGSASWAPTAAGGVSSTDLPAPHVLLSSESVGLRLNFVAPIGLGADAASSFSATVNGAALSLAAATVSGKALVVPFTASPATAYRFVLAAFGRIFVFDVAAAEVYAFPTIVATSRSVPVVTLGQQLTLTSSFAAAFPASATAAVVVTPQGQAAVSYGATVSGDTVSVTHTVAFDVAHGGLVTVTYGAATKSYAWASATLASSSIYTFPSGFTYDGTSNGYAGGAHLKAGAQGALTLTFAGGDMIH
jgi:hypothetical protein